MSPALEQARTVVSVIGVLRATLTLAAPTERAAITRLLDEAEHHVVAACAAAGVHPTARPDVEVVRPSQLPREGA